MSSKIRQIQRSIAPYVKPEPGASRSVNDNRVAPKGDAQPASARKALR